MTEGERRPPITKEMAEVFYDQPIPEFDSLDFGFRKLNLKIVSFNPDNGLTVFRGAMFEEDDMRVEYIRLGKNVLRRQLFTYRGNPDMVSVSYNVKDKEKKTKIFEYKLTLDLSSPKPKSRLAISVSPVLRQTLGPHFATAEYNKPSGCPKRIFMGDSLDDQEKHFEQVRAGEILARAIAPGSLIITGNNPEEGNLFVSGITTRIGQLSARKAFSSPETQPYEYILAHPGHQTFVLRNDLNTGEIVTFTAPDLNPRIGTIMNGPLFGLGRILKEFPVTYSVAKPS